MHLYPQPVIIERDFGRGRPVRIPKHAPSSGEAPTSAPSSSSPLSSHYVGVSKVKRGDGKGCLFMVRLNGFRVSFDDEIMAAVAHDLECRNYNHLNFCGECGSNPHTNTYRLSLCLSLTFFVRCLLL